MRVLRFASLLALPAAVALGAGCMPVKFLSLAGDGDGGAGFGGGTGFGGNNDVTVTTGTTSGGGGAAGISPGPVSYGYMCGGSQATCVPGPDSSECAPGGTGNMGGALPDAGVKLTCQLVHDSEHVAAVCGLAGWAGEGDLCDKAADCQAGLGCAAATTVNGICRQYCCGDPEECPQQTYCTPAAMAEAGADVPLCVPVKSCELLNDGWCPLGQTCTIVRNDGTTSCVDPGPGGEGDACPCAAGFMCSNATGTCLKLCHLNGDECGGGTCQGGTLPYPDNIGFCVPQ